jgi:hypothetical protein
MQALQASQMRDALRVKARSDRAAVLARGRGRFLAVFQGAAARGDVGTAPSTQLFGVTLAATASVNTAERKVLAYAMHLMAASSVPMWSRAISAS